MHSEVLGCLAEAEHLRLARLEFYSILSLQLFLQSVTIEMAFQSFSSLLQQFVSLELVHRYQIQKLHRNPGKTILRGVHQVSLTSILVLSY